MPRLFFKYCTLITLSTVLSLDTVYANDEHINDFATQMAITHTISQDQALTIAKQTEQMGETIGRIRHLLKKRMAGIYAEHQPKFAIIRPTAK